MAEGVTPLHRLPALTDSRVLRLGTFGVLYFAQGLPVGLFTIALPTWLATRGASPAEVASFVAVALLPWSFKLIAAPLMDRWRHPALGRRRPWVVGAQAALLLAWLLFAALGTADAPLALLMALAALANAGAAVQDVAVDGMAIDVLEDEERGRATGLMFGGQVLGIAAASAVGAWLLAAGGPSAAASAMLAATATIVLIPTLIRERPEDALHPFEARDAAPAPATPASPGLLDIGRRLVGALSLRSGLPLLGAFLLARSCFGIQQGALPGFSVDALGWSGTEYPELAGLANLLAAAAGVLLSPLVDRAGVLRSMVVAGSLLVVTFAVAALGEPLWPSRAFVWTLLIGLAIVLQLWTVAAIAAAMTLCARSVAASQFAIYMAAANLSMALGAQGAALLVPLGWPVVFWAGAAVNGLALIALLGHDRDRHRRRLAVFEDA